MDTLSILDFFSQTPNLKINKSDKYYTTFGLIISLISIMFITVFGFYFSFICFYKINYQILERMDNNLIPSFKIFENDIKITLNDPLGNEFEEIDRLYNIEAKFWEINPTAKTLYRIINIPIINQTLRKNETLYRPTTKTFDFKNFDKILYGKYGSLKG
jgi:hypothetical protein